jgi:hypothetical protein
MEKTRNCESNLIRNPIESSREFGHMQLAWQEGQSGNQKAHAEIFCRRHRAVRAVAATAIFPQYRHSRYY